MDIRLLEEKWKLLADNESGNRSLRIDGYCIPDLFVGIQDRSVRCLILKLPAGHAADFQSAEKANLSIELFPDTKWIVLKLLDNRFADLFNDLIFSLYNKICDKNDPREYSRELIGTFYKWSEFFDDRLSFQLSEETVRGIFGELIVLKEFISETSASVLNDLLNGWRGPYNNRRDFILGNKDTEVKTKEDGAADVFISSEFQLDQEAGKEMELMVVNVLPDPDGFSVNDLVLQIREMVTSGLADFTIVLKALAAYGLIPGNLTDYNRFRYKPVSLFVYNCLLPGFPKLVNSAISPLINNVKYNLRVTALNDFLVGSKSFPHGN
jgi:hypothetical protein